jgi:hypothetical protein
MRKWRRESVLDVYNLALAMLLFASPWLFTGPKGVPALDIWASSAAIAAISLAAIFAFAKWEEWANLGFWESGSLLRRGYWASPIPAPCISASASAQLWRSWQSSSSWCCTTLPRLNRNQSTVVNLQTIDRNVPLRGARRSVGPGANRSCVARARSAGRCRRRRSRRRRREPGL